MSKRPLFWTLYPSFLAVLCASLLAVGVFASHRMWRLRLDYAAGELEVRAHLLLPRIPPLLLGSPGDSLQALAVALAKESATRITIVDHAGLVLADTQLPHGSQSLPFAPEIRGALEGERGTAQRYSSTARAELLYVALPIQSDDKIIGALRLSIPIKAFRGELRQTNLHIALLGLVVALAAALIVLWLSRRISSPLARMKADAQHFAAGDFSQPVEASGSTEMSELATALNEMAAQLDEKIRSLTLRRNEQESILTSLREGVIAVDQREHILFVNDAAARLLGVDGERITGRLLTEIIRASELQRFISRMMQGSAAVGEAEVYSSSTPGQVLQVAATELCDAASRRIGLLIVLNDVTRMRRLETVRREFVSNVSHELKTPVTSIKGYIETLREGAMNDPQALNTFLGRIARNADRLNSIIEDLLALSRLEQEKTDAYRTWPVTDLRPVVESALANIRTQLEEKRIHVRSSTPESICARINATLIEQAMVNLLDNAVKYSEPERKIEIESERIDDEACIRIRDHGIGIAAEHLPRIFERFYRVDRARSREQGGTGLGLAIVKHIVQVHGGRVTVESTLGSGSTFTIHLPFAEDNNT